MLCKNQSQYKGKKGKKNSHRYSYVYHKPWLGRWYLFWSHCYFIYHLIMSMYVWSHLWHYCLCINATPTVILSYFRLPYICQLANVPAHHVSMWIWVCSADASVANPADPTDLLTQLFLHSVYTFWQDILWKRNRLSTIKKKKNRVRVNIFRILTS